MFFAKKTSFNVWRLTKFFHNLKNIIVQQNFLEIKKFWKILKLKKRKIKKLKKNNFAKVLKKLFCEKILKNYLTKKCFKN